MSLMSPVKKIAVILLFVLVSAVPVFAQQTQQQAPPPVIALDLFNKAADSLSAQNYQQAVLDLSLFILLNPTYSQAYLGRAQSYLALKDYDHALEDVNHAIDTAPAAMTPDYGAALYTMRGQIDSQQQNADSALEDYSHSITIKPTLQALASRGLLYLSKSDYQSALTDLSSAISMDSSSPALLVYKAVADMGLHDSKSAAGDYLSFFNAIQPNPTIHDPIQTAEPISLQIDQGVVIVLPFTAKANQYVSALAITRSGSVDPLEVLIDSKGQALIGDDDSGGNSNALILNYQVPADGNYGLIVGHSLGGFTGTVSIQFQVSDTPAQ